MSYSWQEWVKTYSCLYRYNSSLVETIRDFFSSSYNTNGYSKLTATMNYEPEVKENFLNAEIDTFKIEYFKKLINATRQNGISMVCVISPSYGVKSSSVYSPIKDVCEEYNVPLFDFYSDKALDSQRDYYKDATHMNDTGARFFTQKLVSELKRIMPVLITN